MAEVAIFLPIYVFIIISLFYFGDAYLLKIRTAQASRYAVMLMSSSEYRNSYETRVKTAYFPFLNDVKVADSFDLAKDSLTDSVNTLLEGKDNNNGAMGTIFKLVKGVVMPVFVRAEVSVPYHSQFVGSGKYSFLRRDTRISTVYTVAGNPWAFDELAESTWLSDYLNKVIFEELDVNKYLDPIKRFWEEVKDVAGALGSDVADFFELLL
ncbi:MAG: hypothetical protein H6685_00355 [Deltaproteobacteria bacterium]|nr:hypothetical protein [Deltaproteobacteria bacterium]